ncbi:PTS cellobiose transporter subunit IIC [Photobacterium profundum]|uniref:Permease IIC component n=1 Tax=Photobacterium profundum (strain SS9) TaxID=298386 RepID=Q6LFS6_PHOPR|nr:PTS cellobiose transporter subunit IIC [Photobacterium profundum]CAG23854.1 hypothetical phosphotransferase systemcellobiose-specific component IIC [Photobacterium profundum SS9]
MNVQLMRVVTNGIEQYISPLANMLTRSKHVSALRDGFQLAMPFVIVGSLFVPLIFPPILQDAGSGIGSAWYRFSVEWRELLLPPFQLTLGLIALMIAFGTSASLAKQYQMPERFSGLTGCLSFLLLAGFYGPEPSEMRYLGGMGIFTALMASFYAIEVIRFFYLRGWYIQLPDEVPTITMQGFKLITPLIFILFTLTLFNAYLQHEFQLLFPQIVELFFQPLLVASDTLTAVLISLLISHLLWFVGIHGALIITGIMNPFWMRSLIENQQALASGVEQLPHIYLQGFWDYYILIGGIGSTLPLIFMAIRSQSKQLRSVGKVGLIPSLFNINEPILFGFPIIMNPLFLIPFICVPLLNASLAWYLTDIGVLDRFVAMLPWSMPAPIGAAWAANGSINNLCMSLLAILNSWFIYKPFFKAHEKMLIEQELKLKRNRSA